MVKVTLKWTLKARPGACVNGLENLEIYINLEIYFEMNCFKVEITNPGGRAYVLGGARVQVCA